MSAQYAYTDRDVRENEELSEIAISYLNEYGGEFEPLVRAKEALEDGDTLPTQTIRMVLNCMRHDLEVQHLLPARVRKPKVKAQQPESKEPKRLTLGADWYNAPSVGKIKVKGDFLGNHHRQARWFHQIDHTKTRGFYYPSNWWRAEEANSIELHEVKMLCGKSIRPSKPDLELLQTVEDALALNEHCLKCQAVAQEAGH